GLAKGMKQVLLECGLWTEGTLLKCHDGCNCERTACCATRIIELQPDFKAQSSLVQEVIEASGHVCIFLPKFHCELNSIEFFWGAVKKYLQEHYNYTFNMLKEKLHKALTS
ncbi:hypothetical protein GLOTRDRAFT_20508, partial [Gloeophyllum trabeum ATCC 11539]